MKSGDSTIGGGGGKGTLGTNSLLSGREAVAAPLDASERCDHGERMSCHVGSASCLATRTEGVISSASHFTALVRLERCKVGQVNDERVRGGVRRRRRR